ncbi:MAG TPA: cytochrome b/b6 domain-containing protein [Candidatus Acidoferrales bacterium]|jgi:thiosulfate reductase cytochrome b subunit|nr:cytochrome b/b6 domain-containing protein [Candidatus Acidoferrales bacterium]
MATLQPAHAQLGTGAATPASPAAAETIFSRHSALVRITHWIFALCFFALLLTGIEILISHPRFYWGETGNDLTKPWLQIPIPSSRNLVPTGYGYVLPDENGWSRALHFEAAWLVLFTGVLYAIFGFVAGHFRKHLVPAGSDLSWRSLSATIVGHLKFRRPHPSEAWSYNVLQRLSYLFVIFVLFPPIVWTGLAMSPTFTAAFPSSVILLGGKQTARTIHFLASIALVLFLGVHILMIALAGFWGRTRAMITGRVSSSASPRERL